MKNNRKKLISILILVITFLVLMVGCNSGEVSDETIIAEYTGGEVTQAEFDKYIAVAKFFQSDIEEYLNSVDEDGKKQILQAYLESYIGEIYLDGKIEKSKEAEDNANLTLQTLKDQTIAELGSQELYDERLKELNITEEDILNYLNRYYNIEDYFVEKEYADNSEEFTVATVSHILIEVKEDATSEDGTVIKGRTDDEAVDRGNEVLTKLNEGEEFSELAKEYSDDPGSKDNGGLYEDYPIAGFVVEFKEAIKDLEIDEVSGLVKTDYGYHIIKVLAKSIPQLEDVSENTRYAVFTNAYNDFYEKELQNIIVSIDL